MGPKVKIDVTEDGEIIVQIAGEQGWHVFSQAVSLEMAFQVLASQRSKGCAKLSPIEVWEAPR